MIVKSWGEAAPIVQEAIDQGKVVGYGGLGAKAHEGHLFILQELRKNCDFSICHTGIFGVPGADPELDLCRRLGGRMMYYAVKKDYKETLPLLEENCDLVITSGRPIPPKKIWDDIMLFTQDKYITPYRQYKKEFFLPVNGQITDMDAALVGSFMSFANIHQNYFRIDVRISSWKEGIRRFIDKKLWESAFGIKQVLVPIVRDTDGLCISTTQDLSQKDKEDLAAFLKKEPFIVSGRETEEGFTKRINRLLPGWSIGQFERLVGS